MGKSDLMLAIEDPAGFVSALLGWFDHSARPLPFRGTRDPYRIWVSEIMLQQTQVATVVPYFQRFVRQFPNVEALASAPLSAVLKLWEGLGYYTRARYLHQAAKRIVQEYKGRFPEQFEEWLTLPGIGRYTAAAIASIAFGQRVPVLDGNVMRVVCRLCAFDQNPKTSANQRKLWQFCADLLPLERPGDFNQAMMELGATVCVPKKPACLICPVATFCKGRAQGIAEQLPRMAKKAPVPHYTVAIGWVVKDGRLLIDQRAPEGFLGGLWELPGGKPKKGETLPQAVQREILEETAVQVDVGRRLCVVRHTYSHFQVSLNVYECHYVGGKARPTGCAAVRWAPFSHLKNYAFAAGTVKIFKKLGLEW